MTNPTPEQKQEAMRPAFEKWAAPQGFRMERIHPDHIDPNGQYCDDDTQAAWEAWQAASAQLSALRAQVDRLRKLAAACYAGLGGECALPDEWLDVLLAAAEGEPFTDEGLLPFESQLRKSHADLATAAADLRSAFVAHTRWNGDLPWEVVRVDTALQNAKELQA